MPQECVVTLDCHCPNDGVTSATTCLRKCISDCHVRAGDGAAQVTFPKGSYYTGALNLTSRMVLQLDDGAEILGYDSFLTKAPTPPPSSSSTCL